MYINTYKHEKTHKTLGFVEFQQKKKTPEIVRRKPTVIVIIIMLSIKNAFS